MAIEVLAYLVANVQLLLSGMLLVLGQPPESHTRAFPMLQTPSIVCTTLLQFEPGRHCVGTGGATC